MFIYDIGKTEDSGWPKLNCKFIYDLSPNRLRYWQTAKFPTELSVSQFQRYQKSKKKVDTP